MIEILLGIWLGLAAVNVIGNIYFKNFAAVLGWSSVMILIAMFTLIINYPLK